MTQMRHVLVVDDEEALVRMISRYLGGHHIEVSSAPDGEGMMAILADEEIDLVILDLKLAQEDGLNILRDLRARSNLPVIVLTGARAGEVDRVLGLELGADDYITKPFSQRELLARIRAVLRRHEIPREEPADRRERYRFAGWEVSLRLRRLTSPSGAHVSLTNGEFNLLLAFVRAPQRVLSREHLISACRVHENEVFDRSIDVQILRLRRKLEDDPSEPKLIKTERGAGYIFDVPVETF
jgi:two-component system OmpR family response regulator